jgi:hypothetical protein
MFVQWDSTLIQRRGNVNLVTVDAQHALGVHISIALNANPNTITRKLIQLANLLYVGMDIVLRLMGNDVMMVMLRIRMGAAKIARLSQTMNAMVVLLCREMFASAAQEAQLLLLALIGNLLR